MLDFFIEQQIAIQMPQRRKLPPHAATVHLIRKQLLQEFAYVVAPGRQQNPLPFLQELRELAECRSYRR